MRQILRMAVLALGLGTLAATAHAQRSQDPRIADLVQAGVLRFGLGLGTPLTAIKDPTTGELKGAALEMGRALAARIGVELRNVEYPRPGAVIAGLRSNDWDVSILVFDPERATQVDFSNPFMQSDFTYLVPAGSSIHTVADADQPGIRIAVPRGDGSDLYLTRTVKRAQLIRTDSHAAALELVRTGGADATSSPRPVLMEESLKLPGSKVLPDGYTNIYFAALVPKGHSGRLVYINEFIEDAKASGLVAGIIKKLGLQGVRVAPAGKLASR